MKNRTIKEPPLVPYWKRRIPKHPEHKEWKRDADGYPIFHDSGVCAVCGGNAKGFTRPWYAFKYQILGFCEPFIIKKLGVAPTKEEEEAAERKLKKPTPIFSMSFLIVPVNLADVAELERIANRL